MTARNNYERIPPEMKRYRQWLVWRYEDRGATKPTKVPYCAVSGKLADVTKATTWCGYEEAVLAATAPGTSYDGIGFVLTKEDPYTIIDLDQPKKESDLERQMQVFTEMNSYAERSPSGTGLHIIVKGYTPEGRRRSSIEMYSNVRFMTMTGDVYHDRPIEARQEIVTELYNAMGANAGVLYTDHDAPATMLDNEVIEKALAANNGVKFRALLEGRWPDYYQSQSEADFAFIDILAFYTQNKDQLFRLFWASPLGQRDKAKRVNYVQSMILRSFDNLLPPIDIIFNREQHEGAVATEPLNVNSHSDASDCAMAELQAFWKIQPITPPPGLLGDIARFIYAQSTRPVEEISIVGAIGLMAGICGRPYNISGTGLNHYLCLLSQTGTGKEAINRGINKLIQAATIATPQRDGVPAASCFVGPSEIASGQALLKQLSDPNKRCFVSVVGEFGLKMQQLASPRASSSEIMLKKVLLDLYNKSGESDVLGGSAYAQKENNTAAIESPAVSIVGETTPTTFYGAIDEAMILDGLLPRFIFVEYTGKRVPFNKQHSKVMPSLDLITKLTDLCATSLGMQAQRRTHTVGVSPEAEAFFDEIERLTTNVINATQADALRDLWNRAHVKTMKLGALVVVGINPHFPVISLEVAQWAFNLIFRDVMTISQRFSRGEVGKNTEENAQGLMVLRHAVDYCRRSYGELHRYQISEKMHTDKVIPQSYFSRRVAASPAFKHDRLGATNAMKRTVQALCDAGDLQEVGKGELIRNYGFSGKAYILAQSDRLPPELK